MLYILYILLIIFALNFNQNFIIEDLNFFEGEYIVYTNESYNNNLDDVIIVPNYNGQIYKTDIKNYKSVLKNVDKVSSETVVINITNINEILNILKANIIEEIDVGNGITLFNCYTKKYNKFVYSNGSKINIQIAVTTNNVNIGYPVLIDY